MANWIVALIGEAKKQKRNYFNTKATYISSFLWPVLNCVTSIFVYSGFDISKLEKYGIATKSDLVLYVFVGLLCYNSFWILVQSALYIQLERENGTLEIAFASPAGKMAIIYGRALGSIIQNIWMTIGFILVMVFVGWRVLSWKLLILAIPILFLSSTIWGGFVNSIFLVSRDTDFWFDLFDSPMDLLSGTKIPIRAFPTWLCWMSFIFPLTYCLATVRCAIMDGYISMKELVLLLLSLSMTVIITRWIVCVAEKKNRQTGGFQLY